MGGETKAPQKLPIHPKHPHRATFLIHIPFKAEDLKCSTFLRKRSENVEHFQTQDFSEPIKMVFCEPWLIMILRPSLI